ncbi:MAG: hypothetical protein ACO3CG_07765, partial [Ilumatobacteraceae bacterium]
MSPQQASPASIASHDSSVSNAAMPAATVAASSCNTRFAIFSECPQCGHALHPEHAHYKCAGCGWRD